MPEQHDEYTVRVRGVVRAARKVEAEFVCTNDDAYGSVWSEARETAHKHIDVPEGFRLDIDHGGIVAVRGPLLARVYWYDLHGPGDVLLLEAAVGRGVPEAACDVVAERLAAMGLTVVDRWNLGCEKVSLRIRGREPVGAKLTPEQVAALRFGLYVEDYFDDA